MADWLQTAWKSLNENVPAGWLWGVLGVVGTLIVTRAVLPLSGKHLYDRWCTEPKSKEKEQKRKSQIRTLLRNSFAWNPELLESMENRLEGKTGHAKHMPTFNIDMSILESTAGLVQLDVLGDVDAYTVIDRARYELGHVARKMNWMSDMYMRRPRQLPSADTTSLDANDMVFYELVRSTISLIQSCQVDCRKAIAELQRLEVPANMPKRRWFRRQGVTEAERVKL